MEDSWWTISLTPGGLLEDSWRTCSLAVEVQALHGQCDPQLLSLTEELSCSSVPVDRLGQMEAQPTADSTRGDDGDGDEGSL